MRGGKGGGLIVQALPHGAPVDPNSPRGLWVSNFTCLARELKEWDDDASEQTDNTGWYYRDAKHSAATGNYFRGSEGLKITTPTASVKRTVAQSLPAGVDTLLIPDSIHWDNNFFWNPTANQSRLTFRQEGLYLVGAVVQYPPNLTARRGFYLIHNNTTLIAYQFAGHGSASNGLLSAAVIWPFPKDTYLEAKARTTAAGDTVLLDALWCVAITPEQLT